MPEPHPLSILLERERAAILTGAFGQLSELAPEKERLLIALPQQGLETRHLQGISAAVTRNQVLLAAAIEGVRTVNERIAVLRRAREGFDAYDHAGARSRVGPAQIGFERKA